MNAFFRYLYRFVLLGLAALAVGCGVDAGERDRLFEKLAPAETGVRFSNDLSEGVDFNILNYLYYYDGGGVAVGDVDGNGLPDLYFVSNEGPNRLYLNRGGFRFDDVTDRAGVAGTADWETGATMADVDGDGDLDLYVTAVDSLYGRRGRNQLYLNRGDGTFVEAAGAFGLDFAGYGTHAAFFDYDRDGDLDAYLVNHSVHTEDTHARADLRAVPHPRAGDRLLRNDLRPDGTRFFTDVSREAGIYGGVVGYGLGVAVSDLDVDGCPDLYVANDFHENDYLYFNNCDGTFTESIRSATGHTSRSSMGLDAADVDGDGLPDIVVLDMLPDREDVRKTSDEAEPLEVAALKLSFGYHHQYVRNTLQLNRGGRRFSEVGQLAGIEATDWSWAPLLADLDNDGRTDLFVTNGIYRRPNDLDYTARVSDPRVQAALDTLDASDLALVASMPQVRVPNYAFRNRGDLTFESVAEAWGLDDDAFASGAAYADLDNDGDLDLVTNNLFEPAGIFRNLTRERTGRRYLTVVLRGDGANPYGVGARVWVRRGDTLQVQELMPTRGFQSSVDPRLHFGLGLSAAVDTLGVVWPDGRFQVLTGVAADKVVTLRQADAAGAFAYGQRPSAERLFEDMTDALGLAYRHRENDFRDFTREPAMPHQKSREGPALAVADVDGDGLDDVFAGGAKWQPAVLLRQRPDGTFAPTDASPWQADSLHEDVDAAFFDADGDGDADLYVASGGNEFWGNAEALRHRFYRNDGTGRFTRDRDALPDFFTHGACIAPADYDGDGDTDLFVGGGVVARAYGQAPQSLLLENDGTGRFRDATAERAPALARAGMVTDAAWADLDGDGALDLVVAGEWMPVRVFRQSGGRFDEATETAGLAATAGLWNAVVAADLDGDGDTDLAAGNLGLNSRIRAAPGAPARLYVGDLDRSGSSDAILTVVRHGAEYPVAPVDDLVRQVPALRGRFRSYADFGARAVDDLFDRDALAAATVLEARKFASTVFLNRGDGTFDAHPLPVAAQFAPVYALHAGDLDADGRTDLLLAGNFSGVTPLRGRYDASYGLFLRGDGAGAFHPVPPAESGLRLDGEVRALRLLRRADGTTLVLAARNDDSLQAIRLRPAPPL